MKKKLLLSFGLLMGLWTFAYAQQNTQGMAVQGAGTPRLYTGTVSTSIPIYTYKDEDFTIPISMNYASNGYEPYSGSDQVALGWSLQAGGSVSQIVRGRPDHLDGWGTGEHYRMGEPTVLGPDIHLGTYTYLDYDPDLGYNETEPDIYAFNFMGHSGKFVFAEGKPYVFDGNRPAGEYQVSVLEQDSLYLGLGYKYDQFLITTGDGYKYLFSRPGYYSGLGAGGKDWQSLEFVIGRGGGGTWNLTKVIAPNGRTVTLEYNEYSDNDNNRVLENVIELPNSSRNTRASIPGGGTLKPLMRMPELEDTWEPDPEKYRIGKITIDDVTIRFASRDSIRVIKNVHPADPVLLKECIFRYHTVDSRRFLDSVKISGVGAYKMDYYDLDVTNPGKKIDHWGYRTKGVDTSPIMSLFPAPDTLRFADFDFNLVAERKPNGEYARWGMLSRITYPTGGYTTFEYEPHTYTDMVTRDYSSSNLPYLKTGLPVATAGGLRISRISDYTMGGLVSTKSYRYVTVDGACSGNLLVRPYYYFHMNESARDMNVPYPSRPRTLRLWLQNSTGIHPLQPHMEYERVEEVYDDGSYTAYEFANYHDTPDTYRTNPDFINSEKVMIQNATLVNNFLTQPDFQPGYRGSLLAKTHYDSEGVRMKEERTFYDTNKPQKYIESVLYAGDRFHVQRTYVESFPVVKQRTTNFFGDPRLMVGNSMTFGYNRLGQVNYVDQNNGERIMRTTYVGDIPGPMVDGIRRQMMSTNTIDPPLTQTISTTASGEEMIVSAEKFEYMQVDKPLFLPEAHVEPYFIKPKKSYKAVISTPVAPGTALNYYETVSYDKYDPSGLLLQKTEHNGLTTTYIWGYKGRYPVAVLVGKPALASLLPAYSEIQPGALSAVERDRIRELAPALCTFYEYDNYGNVATIYDPSGGKVSYTYDADGKLTGEYDENDNLVRSYSYSTHTIDN